MGFFFLMSFFIAIFFLPLGLHRAKLLFDSVEAGVVVRLELVLVVGYSKARISPVIRWALLMPPVCIEHWWVLAIPASTLACSLCLFESCCKNDYIKTLLV